MSRGPGRIERAIRELLDAHPDLAFVTDELAEHCYPGINAIERKHQVAVLRAARSVLASDPNWHIWRITGMGGGYVFVNHASVQSYDIGRNLCSVFPDIIYRSEKRARRRPGEWVRVRGTPWRRKLPAHWERELVTTRGQLLNVVAGGRYRSAAERVVADHIAYRDGDAETRSKLEAKWAVEREATIAEGKRLAARVMGWGIPDDKSCPANDITGRETLTDISQLADKARALITQNDPDVVRAGLAEIADALDAMRLPKAAA